MTVLSSRGRHQSTRPRAETARLLHELLATGVSGSQAARDLGISSSYMWELKADPAGEKTRARKERHRGTCTECGARTCGGAGRAHAPTTCLHCNARANLGKWTPENVVETIQRLAEVLGRPPSAQAAQTGAYAGLDVQRPASLGSLVRASQRHYGSWSAAVTAAGLTHHR